METREVNSSQIKFDNQRKRLFWYPVIFSFVPIIFITLLSIFFINQIIFYETSFSDIIFTASIFILLATVFGSIFIAALFRLGKKKRKKPAFILYKHGITDLSKPFLRFGFVAWDEIESIKTTPLGDEESVILIKLKESKQFIAKKHFLLRLVLKLNQSRFGACIKIPPLLLEGYYQPVCDTIENFWLTNKKRFSLFKHQQPSTETTTEITNEIKFDKNRKFVFIAPLVALIFFSTILLFFGAELFIGSLFLATLSPLGFFFALIIPFFAIVMFFGLIETTFQLKKMLREEPAFLLDKNGITDRSKLFLTFGFIAWNDIASIESTRSSETGEGFILIKLKDPETFIAKQPFLLKKILRSQKRNYNATVVIQTINLEGHFQPIVDTIKNRWQKYRS